MEISQTELHIVALMISTGRLTRNDDSEACDGILEIGNIFSRNGVKCGFHRKSFKCSLW